MAIDSTTVFDRIQLSCSCRHNRLRTITPRNGTSSVTGGISIHPTSTDQAEMDQLDIMREAVENGHGPAAATNLDGLVTKFDTSFDVDDATVFDIDVNDKIVIDDEVMTITAVSGNELTVTRGEEGTDANGHDDNAGVFKQCKPWYYDAGWIAYDDLPIQHWLLHTLHQMHPDNRWKSIATMMLSSDVTTDSTTGKDSVTFGSDVGSAYRVPDGDNFDAPLNPFHIVPIDDDEFYLRKYYPRSAEKVAADFDSPRDDHDWQTMEAWLHDKSTTSFTGQFDDVFISDFLNRQYEFEQTSGSTVRFSLVNEGVTLGYYTNTSPEVVKYAQIRCDVSTLGINDDDYNEAHITNYLATETVSVPVGGRAIQPTEVGGDNSHGRFERLFLGPGNNYLEVRPDGHIIHAYENDTREVSEIPITGNFGDSVNIADITVATGDTYKRFPVLPHQNSVHMEDDAAADENLQLPLPVDAIGVEGRNREYVVHNKSNHKLSLRDWDGAVFFVLRSGERATFRLTQENGAGGEFSSISVPVRKLIYTMTRDDSSLDELDDLKRLDSDNPDANGDFYVMPYPTGTESFQVQHGDYFETKSTTFTDDTDVEDITTEANFWHSGAWKILGGTSGLLRIEAYILMQKQAGSSGSMVNPRIQLYRFDGSDVDLLMDQVVESVWESGVRVPLRMVSEALIGEGHIFLPGIYRPAASTLSADDIRMRQVTMDITVQPRVTLEYTP